MVPTTDAVSAVIGDDAQEAPVYLYHYTSIETLALILSNRTIRFRRLDLMDDPDEAVTSDLGRQGKYVLVSCWTDREDEDLLTWSLYTERLRGVRLRFPVFPFDKRYRVTEAEVRRHSGIPVEVPGDGFDSYVSSNDALNDRYVIQPSNEINLIRVKYTDDESLLRPRVYFHSGSQHLIRLSELGRHKWPIWSSQSEWRYRMFVFPMTREIVRAARRGRYDLYGALVKEAMMKEQDPGIEHIDIPIREEVYQSLEVTLGPRATESDRIIVLALVSEFAPAATVRESTLTGSIR